MLLLVGNPQVVSIQLLFWRYEIELYKIIIASVAGGALCSLLYRFRLRSLRGPPKGSSPEE